MFDQTFVDAQAQTRRPWTVAVSLTLQIALVAIALILPLLHIASLEVPTKIPVWLPVGKVDLNVKPEVKAVAPQTARRPIFHSVVLQAPTIVPARIDMSPDAPVLAEAGTVVGRADPSLIPLLPGLVVEPPPAQTAAPKPPLPAPAAIRVGGGVQSAKLIFGPKPAYPPLARTTRIQGTVKIQALIGRDGVIRNLQVISGPPLLIAAAIEAVRQWRYQATLLNAEPVEVITEIDVNFTLSQ
jgi:periplasmic protein TonB